MSPVDLRAICPHQLPELASELRTYFAEIAPGQALDADAVAARQFGPLRYPFWILREDDRAGFALAFSHENGPHELAEFTIFPSARRSGLGNAAVRLLFARLPGRWRIGVVGHGMAETFWESALPGMPDLEKGPPMTPLQSHSYTFMTDQGDAP